MVKEIYIIYLFLFRKLYGRRRKGWASSAYVLGALPIFLFSASILFLVNGNIFSSTKIPGVIIGKIFAIPFVIIMIIIASRVKLNRKEARKYFELSAKIGKWLPILLLVLSIIFLIASFVYAVGTKN